MTNPHLMQTNIPDFIIEKQVRQALKEDIASGDVSAFLIDAKAKVKAELWLREEAVLCGQKWFEYAIRLLDSNANIKWDAHDGDLLSGNQKVCSIEGLARQLLTSERTAINFLQTLSGTATRTHTLAKHLQNSSVRLLDTRKTIPGLRSAQKYAVLCGGGYNHRHNLSDGLLIKENHIMAAGGIAQVIKKAKRHTTHGLKIEIEVENLEEVKQALEAGADILLLDNMNLSMLEQAVRINKNHKNSAKLEVSGNIQTEQLEQLANIGIDYISMGSLTKNLQSIDFSLRFK